MKKILPSILTLLISSLINAQEQAGRSLELADTVPPASQVYVLKNILKDTAPTHAHVNPGLIDQAQQSSWIETTMNGLREIKEPESAPIITLRKIDLEDIYLMSYRLKGSGIIQFDNGDWIYLVSNSSHNAEQIGDLTLAIDNKGEIFINEGHVCGGIINFLTKRKMQVSAASQFFENFISDTDSIGWKSLNKE